MKTSSLIVLCFFTILAGIVVWWAYTDEQALIIVRVSVIAFVTSIVGTIVMFTFIVASNRYADTRQKMAEANRAIRDAQITIAQAGAHDQVYISDTNPKATWRAAHRDPRILASDGQWTDPRPADWQSFLAVLAANAARANAVLPPDEPWQTEQQPPPLLSLMDKVDRALIVGASGSGKTTVLQHIIAQRFGQVVVIDPHDDTHTWPSNAEIVGGGQNYGQIESALVQLTETVRRRYELRSTGEPLTYDNCPPLTVVIDEWREITQEINGAGDRMKKILTAGRKVSTATFVSSQSDRARPLGIVGEADLRDGFVIARLTGNPQVGFQATVDTGQGEFPVSLPGPFIPTAPGIQAQRVIDPSLPAPPAAREQRILQKFQAGTPITEIGRQEFGDGRSKGGEQNELVKEVLRKFGIAV